jgi:drug/metabolite transporter (DMT)-like permease
MFATNHDFLLPGTGMCVGYICHDALQERMFRFDGFTFGSFMTLAEVTIMILGALLLEGGLINKKKSQVKKKSSFLATGEGENSTLLHDSAQAEQEATSPAKLYYVPGGSTPITSNIMTTAAMIGVCIAISHGCGNTALRYSTYPLKVAFKSCKLLPTMWLGHLCLLKKTFHRHQYGSAIVMCIGLVVLTLADSDSHDDDTKLHMLGPILLAVSTSLDSVVPNLQERLFTTTSISTNEVMLLSNLWMFAVSLIYTTVTGELQAALSYCIREQPQTLAVLLVQASCAYVGLRCYLTVIQHHGGVAAVLLANGRKIITISLSFLLWSKPFTKHHGMGLGLIFLGVYLGVVAKQRQRKNKAAAGKKQEDESNNHVTTTTISKEKDSAV